MEDWQANFENLIHVVKEIEDGFVCREAQVLVQFQIIDFMKLPF